MTRDVFDDVWNDEVYEDVQPPDYSSVVVYSRDWTVETIVNQMQQANIDLNPKFQRRNAWDDEKRSRLIESLIIGVPVPQIVLAEEKDKKKSFLVIDGKQRLLTILGFIEPQVAPYWERPRLTKLKSRDDLNTRTYQNFSTEPSMEDVRRALLNADIRCTVISNYSSNDILYDIFYRLNTGSAPLSTQELRQVLYKGPFADALIDRTNKLIPLHDVLKLDEPDPRLRDVELILRSLALDAFGSKYRGNLKRFLDESMQALSKLWIDERDVVVDLMNKFDEATQRAISALGADQVGRKYVNGKLEGRFNRSVFEAEVYYFWRVPNEVISDESKGLFLAGFIELCDDPKFRKSIEATTKTNESYFIRFDSMRRLINTSFGLSLQDVPVNPVAE